MTTPITNTSAARAVTSADLGPTSGLDAQGVLTYCSSRLTSLDALIQSRFDEQKRRNETLHQAGALIAQLNSWTFVASGDLSDAALAGHKGMGAAIARQANAITDPELRGQAAQAYRIVTGKDLVFGPNGQVEPAQLDEKTVTIDPRGGGAETAAWQGFIGKIKAMQDGLTKDSELSMIQLQSVVSQRQLAVQMTTQLLQTMSESTKQVVSNIR
jgi:hypothetical protein